MCMCMCVCLCVCVCVYLCVYVCMYVSVRCQNESTWHDEVREHEVKSRTSTSTTTTHTAGVLADAIESIFGFVASASEGIHHSTNR